MKASTRWTYGIVAVLEMAENYNNGPVQLRLIAERHRISVKYLEQLMVFLRSAGIIRSVRGAKGGYMLTTAPENVRISELFHCMEGNVVTVDCVNEPTFCPRSMDCAAHSLWCQVETAINDVLEAVTLQDLLDRSKQLDYQI